jgi:ribosomal protein L40E
MAAKIPEAQARLFKNVYVCKKCTSKIKGNPQKVLEGKVKCRKCGKNALRVVKKK